MVKRQCSIFIASLLIGAGIMGRAAYASAPTGDLTIIELKMTGSESMVLENMSPAPINLGDYLIDYFNKAAPTSLAVPTSSQLLPDATLDSHQAILISGDSSLTCGAAIIANEAFSLSDTNGYLMVNKVGADAGGNLVFAPQDEVSWTSSAAGADLVKVPSSSSDPAAVWYRSLIDGSWQKAELGSDCDSLYSIIPSSSNTTYIDWAAGTAAPATIVSLSAADGSGIPATDQGLAAPQITEVLPNPASPQTDAEDEFIELYNPNASAFDLSGFRLQVGTTSKHSFEIPDGTLLPAKSFKAFYSIDTGLAMSNSGGQVALLDPLGQSIGQTDAYGTAKEGQSWALANGHWYWTSTPTPGQANRVNQAGQVKAASTSHGGSQSTAAASSAAPASNPPTSQLSLQPLTLALVGSGALIYAAYEYRYEVASNFGKLRRYYQSRRSAGK